MCAEPSKTENSNYLESDISTYTMADLKHLGLDSMQSVVDYVADNVNVSRFM